MKPDDFEKRLQSQPLRQIPTEWRAQILPGANSSAALITRRSLLSTINHQLSTLLWPNSKAWAGLAAVWALIFALQFASRGNSRVMATVSAPQPATVLMTLKDQQQTLAELMGNNPPNDADRPHRIRPQPRSQLRNRFSIT